MGRKLMRVPLDFDWPRGIVWYGYHYPFSPAKCPRCDGAGCERCKGSGELWPSEELRQLAESWDSDNYPPPSGDGYQLWETTSEGSPISPVFQTLDDLAAWCEENATVFAGIKAVAAEWRSMLAEDNVHARAGSVIFI